MSTPVALPVNTTSSSTTLRSDLCASVWDAGAYSVMVGIAESYFGAYALALGLGPAGAGLLVTLPVLLGSIVQLSTPWGVQKVGSHKRWIVTAIFLQVSCLVALPLAALFVSTTAALVAFAAVSCYWASGLAGGPPWNTWMEELVPLRVRTRFFACRQRTSQICLLGGFVLGGIALQYGRSFGYELAVFAGIFLIAAIARFISGVSMASQSEPSRGKLVEERVSLSQLFGAGGHRSGGNLVVYLLAMQVAVQISGPFFTPFMLQEERLSYLTYMVLFGISFLGKVIALPLWGRVGQRIGTTRLMWIGGLMIVPLSSLWLMSDLFRGTSLNLGSISIPGPIVCIGAIQFLSGLTWAAYELAMALSFLHGIPRKQRTSMLTLYNFGNSGAMVFGGLIGVALLRFFGTTHTTYMMIFALSSVMRFAMIPLLLRIREPVADLVPSADLAPSLKATESLRVEAEASAAI